jgi:hypothetical protein
MAASYVQALMWAYTRNIAYAHKAAQILNAWSGSLKSHSSGNADLMVAWGGEMFVRGAEIIRHTAPKKVWPKSRVKRFEKMLIKKFVPHIKKGVSIFINGNWELSMADALMNIGVFCNNRKIYKRGVAIWKRRVPAYIYLKSDGKLPNKPPMSKGARKSYSKKKLIAYWYGQTKFHSGMAQETCRDFAHTNMGIAAMVNAAETARIQGMDLYGKQKKRIVAAVEFHANYFYGNPVPSWLCKGALKIYDQGGTYEIAYNHYALRKGISMPNTRRLLERIRPTFIAGAVYAAETLTHGLLNQRKA